MKFFYRVVFLSAFFSLLWPLQAYAQTERLPGVVDRPTPDIQLPAESKPVPLKDAPEYAPVAGGNDPLATISRVEFSGATVLSEARLQEIAAPYLNRLITKNELAQLKFEITKAFYDEGYILVKVVTPSQNLSSGVLKIEIYEGEVGNVKIIDNQGVLQPYIADGFTDTLSGGAVFRESDVETFITNLNELKGVAATLNLQPGERFKTTDMNVFLGEVNEDRQSLTVDTYGSELTGKNIASLHLEKSNLLHLGETISTDLRQSNEDLWSVAVGTGIPTGFRNVMLELGVLHSQNEIGDRLAALDASGKTNRGTLGLSSKLINTRKEALTTRVGFEARSHESYLADATDTKDDIRQLFVETSYLRRADKGVVYASGRVSKGINVFGASEEGDALATRAAGDNEAVIFEPLVIVNFRPDIIPYVPPVNGDIKLVLSGQFASETVLSSDLFSIGGYGSVRGFDLAQETGDSGYQFSVEYNHNIPVEGDWTLRAGPFIDGGSVFNRIDGSTEDDHLYSAGIGAEAVARLIPAGDTKLRFDLAHPINSYSSRQVDDTGQLYFSVSQSF